MQLNQRLNIKHSQSIVMTPQLRQAIKLLQFSNLELSSYIEEEIEKNPFLENKKNDILARSDNSKLQKINNNESFTDDNDKDNQRWEEKFHNKQRGNSFDDISSLEDRIAEPKKSKNTLNGTNTFGYSRRLERKVAILLLDLIEPSGWIKLDIDQFAIKNNLQKE